MGPERFERYLHSFEEAAPVSIRLNPKKVIAERGGGSGVSGASGSSGASGFPGSSGPSGPSGEWQVVGGEPVPWCRNAFYLFGRPNFTFDPLFHAGCYYVQEAASMFLDEVLRQHVYPLTSHPSPLTSHLSPLAALDLCAAPGGKSTLLRVALPEDCALYSNEPVRQRASILLENVTKWGYQNHYVTNLYPRDYRKSKMRFDLILCDVPCSGEGMFRKDPATIGEWSPQNVEKCWKLQREIVSDAWACLREGGILIYSTCTFNTKENEENIRWMQHELGVKALPVETKPEWHITGSLLSGFNEPVYRFIPGISRGEGLFMCVMQKPYQNEYRSVVLSVPGSGSHSTAERYSRYQAAVPTLPISGSTTTPERPTRYQLSYTQAMAYLRREALTLPPDTPRGIVEVCFMGQPLGLVKNIGNRANNLYPKEWRIKTTHIPQDYEPVLINSKDT